MTIISIIYFSSIIIVFGIITTINVEKFSKTNTIVVGVMIILAPFTVLYHTGMLIGKHFKL